MQQLRPHLTDEQALVEQVRLLLTEGYHLVYSQDRGEATAIAGFRFLEFLAWGRVLYIDDLITDSGAQRNGHRRKLLKWLIEQGKQAKCDQIHLDSAFQGEKRSLKQGDSLSECLHKKGKS